MISGVLTIFGVYFIFTFLVVWFLSGAVYFHIFVFLYFRWKRMRQDKLKLNQGKIAWRFQKKEASNTKTRAHYDLTEIGATVHSGYLPLFPKLAPIMRTRGHYNSPIACTTSVVQKNSAIYSIFLLQFSMAFHFSTVTDVFILALRPNDTN